MNKNEEVVGLYSKYVMQTYAQSLVLVRGKGAKVWDATGKVYLDFMSGISVLNAGHCHPKVVKAVQDQAANLMHVSNLFYNEPQGKLAEKLSKIGLGGKCFFANSGAEANEGMIKLARLWGSAKGKHEIICLDHAFHGRTLATLAATGQEKYSKGFEPLPTGFVHGKINDLDSVKALVNDKTVAIMVEAIQGEGGVIVATDDFLKGVRALCDEKGLLMLCDEVQCGMGRTGNWWGFEASGVKPDAFSSAKSLGNGFPIGAIIASPKVSDVFTPGKHASTFGGTPLACAAALATINLIEEEALMAKSRRMGDLFKEALQSFMEKYEHLKEVRGRGLMLAIELDIPSKPLCEKLAELGLLALPTGDMAVRFLPPMIITDNELEEALDIIDDSLAEIHGIVPVENEG
jgi:predicted acetylornithine/succinylornithine family transaminase